MTLDAVNPIGGRMMKKLVLIAVFVIGFSMVAVGQDIPAYQFFGGYSSLHNQTIDRLANTRSTTDLNGWDLSVALNGKKNWAAVIDIGGNYGKVFNKNAVEATIPVKNDHNFKSHTLMWGPKASFHVGKFTPFVQGLIGIVHTNVGGRSLVQLANLTYRRIGDRETTNNFGCMMGGGLDIKINEKFGVRALQVEYMLARAFGEIRNNIRFSTGITYQSGKRY
jgi:hypothetical protein